jgi:uncharacterized protein YbcI
MEASGTTQARQIARAVSDSHRERTGRALDSVTVVQASATVVATLHGALAPAERALTHSPRVAGLLREFHRALFHCAGGPLRREIERITGAKVREAVAEVQGTTGVVVQLFALDGDLPTGTWSGFPPAC